MLLLLNFQRWDNLVLIALFSSVNSHCFVSSIFRGSYISVNNSCLTSQRSDTPMNKNETINTNW